MLKLGHVLLSHRFLDLWLAGPHRRGIVYSTRHQQNPGRRRLRKAKILRQVHVGGLLCPDVRPCTDVTCTSSEYQSIGSASTMGADASLQPMGEGRDYLRSPLLPRSHFFGATP